MNKLIVLTLCVLTVIVTITANNVQKFDTKYDTINLDDILHNDRLLNNYINCVLEKGKCSNDGAELRSAIPEAITNECAGCSEKQKEGAKKVAKFLRDNKPDIWEAVLNKYDSDGKLREKYKDQIDKLLA